MVGKSIGMGTLTTAPWAMVLVIALAFVAALALASDDAEAQGTKDITLYFHNVTESVPIGNAATLRIMDTRQGGDPLTTTTPTINSVKTDLYLYPALAEEVTVEGRITVYMWAIRTVRMGDADQATLIWELFDVDENGTKVAKVSRGLRTLSMIIDWRQYWVTNDTVAKYTIDKGHYLLLEFELQGSSSNEYQVGWGDASYRSCMVIESHDYLLVEHAEARDINGAPRLAFDYDAPVKDVTLHADVTDPWGGYDVRLVNATLLGPAGGTIVDDAAMTRVSGYFTSFRSGFELPWNYDGYPAGMYTLTVTAVDNSGWYFRYPSHPESETFGGHLESLSVVFWIGGPPQEVAVEVLDNVTLPLEGAVVTVYETSNATDASGVTMLMVSNGTFPLWVHWQGILVYEGEVTVDGPTTVNVSVAVYHPTFVVVDDLGDPLEDAVALVEHPNGTVMATFGRTDDLGAFGLSQVPGGEYGITLLWLGTPVHEGSLVIDGNGPYPLITWVYTLDIRVEDGLGTGLDLAQVIAYNCTSHLVMDSRLTDMDGNLTVRLPLGSYDMDVIWRGKLVHDATRDHLVNASAGMTLLADIFRLDLTISDSAGLPLTDAKVVIADADGDAVLDFGITDGDGDFWTRLAAGTYSVSVYWRDVLVHITPDLEVTGHDLVPVTATVHWVTLTVLDSAEEPLEAAGLALVHSSGQSFGTQLTDGAGEATFRLPEGAYAASVTWMGVGVLEGDVTVSSAEPQVLRVAVHHVTFLVVDTLGQPLAGAMVTATVAISGQGAGTGITVVEGGTVLRLPEGNVTTSVIWLDSLVHEGVVTVNGTGPFVLIASVHVVTLRAVDSAGEGLASALVGVVNQATDRSFGTAITGVDGEATFRIPAGSYDTVVTWKDHQVLDASITVSSNDPIVLECSVFYASVVLRDSLDFAVEGAHVVVSMGTDGPVLGSQVTGPDGTARFRLPGGAFDVTVDWLGVTVLEDAIAVWDDGTLIMSVSVHYAGVSLVDSRDEPVADARLVVTLPGADGVLAVGTTDADGSVTLRLPAATYSVEVTWKAETCLVADMEVTGDVAIGLVAWVHYLTLHAVDGEGVDLADAEAMVTNSTTGVVLGSGATAPDGTLELRLPRGTFALGVTWMGVGVHSDDAMPVEGDGTHPVNATVHYLTVKVRGADGGGVGKVTISAASSERTFAAGETTSDGSLVLRLPAGAYTVRMTLRTTYRLSDIDVSMSEEVDLDASQTLRFDLDDTQFPIPVYRTNLFLIVLAIVLMVLVILYLLRRAYMPPREGDGPSVEEDDLEVDLEEARLSLTDEMDESEIDLEDED